MSLVWLFLFSTLITLGSTASAAKNYGDLAELNPLHVESVAILSDNKEETFKPGQQAEVRIALKLDDGFHAYAEQFKLKLIGPPDFFLSEPQIKPLVKFVDPISKKVRQGAEGSFELHSLLDVKSAASTRTHTLEIELTYQACTKDFCLLPKRIPIVKTLEVANSSPLNGTLQEAFNKGWFYTLLFVFLAGVLTSLTPCIFPMIPITLAIIGSRNHHHSHWRGFFLSLTYVMGIALTYSLLGIFAAKTGAIFGSYLGHPMVVTGIAIVFVIMGLSMFGLFDIEAPQFVTSRISNIKTKQNFVGAFISGLIAGIVASPCVGPVLLGILTFVAQTHDVFKGFILLFTFALGLGQLFIILGTFHSLLKKIPKSGHWLENVKKVFGLIMFGMAFYYLYPVIKKPIESYLNISANSATHGESYLKPDWKPYSDELVAQAKVDGKPVIIDFNAEWCVACKELEKYTFSDPRIIDLGKNFVWLSFDATNPSEELDVLQNRYGISGLPFVVLIGPDGNLKKDLFLTGFEDANAFLKRMESTTTRP